MKRHGWHVRCISMLSTLVALGVAAPAHAATFRVNTTADSSVTGGCVGAARCSLRDAVKLANTTVAADAIALPRGTFRLTQGELNTARNLTIAGAGARDTTIVGDGHHRVLDNSYIAATLTLRDLTVTGGNAVPSGIANFPGDGGGVLTQGNLSLLRVAIRGNRATFSGGGLATPGVSATAPNPYVVSVQDSTISGNAISGAGVAQGGGLLVYGQLRMQNSTVAGNTITTTGFSQGGGMVAADGSATIVNSTIVGNRINAGASTPVGGGIAGDNLAEARPVASRLVAGNTIVADNFVGSARQDCALTDTRPTTNQDLSSDASCRFGDPGSLQNTEPGLGSLGANGGPTDTRKPLVGSAALDHGANGGCPSTDQRGVRRPQGGLCDIGAVELAPPRVVTGKAASVSSRGASFVAAAPFSKLTGTATNPYVGAGASYFQIGRTARYGKTVGVRSVPAQGSSSPSVRVKGLRPHTRYHYRLVAINGDGGAAGADRAFRTAIARPRLRVTGVRRGCTRGAFTVRVRVRVGAGTRLRSVRVRIDRRLIRRTKRSRFGVRVGVRSLRHGRHRISVRATDRGGRSVVVSRALRVCGPAPSRIPRFAG